MAYPSRVQELAASVGMKPLEFCLEVGFSPSTLYTWENGLYKPSEHSMKKMEKFAAILIDKRDQEAEDNFPFGSAAEEEEDDLDGVQESLDLQIDKTGKIFGLISSLPIEPFQKKEIMSFIIDLL